MTTRTADTRPRLLRAAPGILMEGEGALTFDAVAKRVGISKGGIIHHFPTRKSSRRNSHTSFPAHRGWGFGSVTKIAGAKV